MRLQLVIRTEQAGQRALHGCVADDLVEGRHRGEQILLALDLVVRRIRVASDDAVARCIVRVGLRGDGSVDRGAAGGRHDVVALGQKADDIVVGEQVVRHVPAARVQRRWTCSALTAGAAARRRCGGQQLLAVDLLAVANRGLGGASRRLRDQMTLYYI